MTLRLVGRPLLKEGDIVEIANPFAANDRTDDRWPAEHRLRKVGPWTGRWLVSRTRKRGRILDLEELDHDPHWPARALLNIDERNVRPTGEADREELKRRRARREASWAHRLTGNRPPHPKRRAR